MIGPNISLPEGTVVSMHHPEEEEEDDEDEFLSDDAQVDQGKDKTKQKGAWRSEVKLNHLLLLQSLRKCDPSVL